MRTNKGVAHPTAYLALALDHIGIIDSALESLEQALKEETPHLTEVRDQCLIALNHRGMHLDFDYLYKWFGVPQW